MIVKHSWKDLPPPVMARPAGGPPAGGPPPGSRGGSRHHFQGKYCAITVTETGAPTTTFEKDFGLAPRNFSSHDHEQIMWFLEGAARVFVGDESVDVVAGDMVYCPPNARHTLMPMGDKRVVFAEIFAPAPPVS